MFLGYNGDEVLGVFNHVENTVLNSFLKTQPLPNISFKIIYPWLIQFGQSIIFSKLIVLGWPGGSRLHLQT